MKRRLKIFARTAAWLALPLALGSCKKSGLDLSETPSSSSATDIPIVLASPALGGFGAVLLGNSQNLDILFANSGLTTVKVGTAIVSDPVFSIVGNTCDDILLTGAGSTCTVSIRFTPTALASSSATLTLPYTSAQGLALSTIVSLTGVGGALAPTLTSGPSTKDFGGVATNARASQIFTITNNSTVSAITQTANISGSGYTIGANTCNGITISSGGTCSITVLFAPASVGVKPGTLSLQYLATDGSSTSTLNVALTGTGITPSVSFSFSGFNNGVAAHTSSLTATGVTLGWTAPSGGSASYFKIFKTVAGLTTSGSALSGSTTSYNVTGLAPNTTYSFRVNAYDVLDVSDGNTNTIDITTPNVTGATFGGWSDVVALGQVFTAIGAMDNTLGNTGANRYERNLSLVAGFGPTDINTTNGNLTVSINPFQTGQKVKFRTDGSAPAGLNSGVNYYAISVNATTLQLAATPADALAGIPIIPSTQGTGNMTLMPKAVVKLAWETFSFTPSGVATGYNIYRSTFPTSGFILIGSSTSRTYIDYETTEETTYYYLVRPVISGVEIVAATSADSTLQVYVPPTNMSLVHRWMANREACTTLLGFSWPAGVNRNDNYSCAYTWGTGFAPNYTGSKSKWDLGYSLVIDRWQNGCNFSGMGTAAASGGATNAVYLRQGSGTTTGTGSLSCAIKSGTLGWTVETSAALGAADRALLRTNQPGYASTPILQSQAYNTCQTRTGLNITDGNGNGGMRLMRLHEAVLARAIQGVNINFRNPSLLTNIFNGISLPSNGSCNITKNNQESGGQLDGVSLPTPSAYPAGKYQLMNGTSLTRNCYSRYEISDLWNEVSEWTSTQYYAASANTGSFTASVLDPGDNLLENFLTNGSMGLANVWNNLAYATLFGSTGASGTLLPLFGVRTVSVDPALGSRTITMSSIDFGAPPNAVYVPISVPAINTNGVILGSYRDYGTSSSRYRISLENIQRATGVDSLGTILSFRCTGVVGP